MTLCAAIKSVPTKNVAIVSCPFGELPIERRKMEQALKWPPNLSMTSWQMACPSGITGTQEAPCESPCKCLCKRKETGRHQTPEPTTNTGLQHVCLAALHIEYQGQNKGHPWHSHAQTYLAACEPVGPPGGNGPVWLPPKHAQEIAILSILDGLPNIDRS